jgi:prepilin-type N-terminal cleavage/methylation domain-containing protein
MKPKIQQGGLMSPWKNPRGFSLIEVVMTLVISGIMMLVATEGVEFYQASQVRSASMQLYSAIEMTRQNALTKQTQSPIPCGGAAPPCIVSRGFGLRLVPGPPSGYLIFEFNDKDDDNNFDGTSEELAPVNGPAFPGSVQVIQNAVGVLRYDERGLARSESGAFGARTYTISHTNLRVGIRRCVVVSAMRVREGAMDATNNCV